jgi:hypothetical protein
MHFQIGNRLSNRFFIKITLCPVPVPRACCFFSVKISPISRVFTILTFDFLFSFGS